MQVFIGIAKPYISDFFSFLERCLHASLHRTLRKTRLVRRSMIIAERSCELVHHDDDDDDDYAANHERSFKR